MPIYIYETIEPSKPRREIEIKQSVHDDPIRIDPETGDAIRRIISAGFSILVRGKSTGPCVGSCG
jgi:predicted nucleic acid-binding Zn ribbon protein